MRAKDVIWDEYLLDQEGRTVSKSNCLEKHDSKPKTRILILDLDFQPLCYQLDMDDYLECAPFCESCSRILYANKKALVIVILFFWRNKRIKSHVFCHTIGKKPINLHSELTC